MPLIYIHLHIEYIQKLELKNKTLAKAVEIVMTKKLP